MRSENVFSALVQVPNRFLLTKLAAKATRKFHRPYTRIQRTMDDVFVRFSQCRPMPERDSKLRPSQNQKSRRELLKMAC